MEELLAARGVPYFMLRAISARLPQKQRRCTLLLPRVAALVRSSRTTQSPLVCVPH
jgi:hypothetical protein